MFLLILFTSAIFHHRFLFVHFVTSPLLEFCHTLITLTFASRIIFRHHYPPFALSSVSTLVSTTDSTLFFDAPLFSSVFPLFFPLFFPPLPIRLWIFMHPRVVVPLTVLLFFLVISSYLSLSLPLSLSLTSSSTFDSSTAISYDETTPCPFPRTYPRDPYFTAFSFFSAQPHNLYSPYL